MAYQSARESSQRSTSKRLNRGQQRCLLVPLPSSYSRGNPGGRDFLRRSICLLDSFANLANSTTVIISTDISTFGRLSWLGRWPVSFCSTYFRLGLSGSPPKPSYSPNGPVGKHNKVQTVNIPLGWFDRSCEPALCINLGGGPSLKSFLHRSLQCECSPQRKVWPVRRRGWGSNYVSMSLLLSQNLRRIPIDPKGNPNSNHDCFSG